MPMDRSRYPDNWKAISDAIRFGRAGGRCEKCGLAHGQLIIRSSVDPARYLILDESTMIHQTMEGEDVRLSEIPDEFSGKYVRVILTCHHIGIPYPDGSPGDVHDKMDCRPENLLALCQRCHFIEDLPIHIPKAQAARRNKKRPNGKRKPVGSMKNAK